MLRALALLFCGALATGARSGDGKRVAAAAAAAAGDLPPQASPHFGEAGELWRPDGPLPDFSFAGWRFGDEELPSPPVTRRLSDFLRPGVNDSAALQAAVDWANAQPESAGKLAGLLFRCFMHCVCGGRLCRQRGRRSCCLPMRASA